MDYNMMSGANGGGMMFFSWVTYILMVALLILGIVALWKYVTKK